MVIGDPLSFFNELKRRNVIRVATAYVVASWLIIQVVETIFPIYGLGDIAIRSVITALAVAFVPTLVFSWVFEFTPEGLKREVDVVREHSITRFTGKKLDRIIIVLLAFAVGYFAFDKFVLDPVEDVRIAESAHQEGRSAALTESYGDKSIAVLPFANMSADPDQEYFSDGISEELLNLLSKIPQLRVISRSSAFTFKGKDIAIPEIAKILNVANILEGSVRKAGDQVRITVQLIGARSDTHLWSETYDRKLEDIFAIQDEVAAEVVEQLKIVLFDQQIPNARQTSPEAYEAYLWGNKRYPSFRAEDLRLAIEDYEQAIELDPNYAPAYEKLGAALYVYRYVSGAKSAELEEYLSRAKDAYLTALKIDDRSAFAISGLAWFEKDMEQRMLMLRKAVELNPNDSNALARVAYNIFAVDLEEAEHFIRRSLEVDPLNANNLAELGRYLWDMGRDKEALAEMNKAIEANPDYPYSYLKLASWMYWDRGRIDEAMRYFRRMYALSPDTPVNAGFAASAYASLGARREADAWLRRALELDGSVSWPWGFGSDQKRMSQINTYWDLIYWDQLLQRNPANDEAVGILAWLDIDPEHAKFALELYRNIYPKLTQADSVLIDESNIYQAVEIAPLLMSSGHSEDAKELLRSALSLINEKCAAGKFRRFHYNMCHARSWIHVLLGQKDEALVALRREIIDGNQRPDTSSPKYDFLRDEPEFIHLMEIVAQEMAEQLERVREMERNGEFPNAPGITFESG